MSDGYEWTTAVFVSRSISRLTITCDSTIAHEKAGNFESTDGRKKMPRRRASFDQASIARAIRAAKANGAAAVEVQQPDGTIIRIVITETPLALEQPSGCDIVL